MAADASSTKLDARFWMLVAAVVATIALGGVLAS